MRLMLRYPSPVACSLKSVVALVGSSITWPRRGARVLGVDLSAGMLAMAARRVPGRLVRADAQHLPLPDAVADAAVTVATLEFVDTAVALAELARITRPGAASLRSRSIRSAPGGCSTNPLAATRMRAPSTSPARSCTGWVAGMGRRGCKGGCSLPRTPVSRTTWSRS